MYLEMSVASRIRGLDQIISESLAFTDFGLSPFWYFRFHYHGRWNDRWSRPVPEQTIKLIYRGRSLWLPLTAMYAGVLKGVFLDDQYALADVLDRAPLRILDLGANIGMAAAVLAAQFPEAKFLLVEPDPRNVERLQKTARWNGLTGAIVCSAVACSAGRLCLRIGDDPTCSALETSALHILPESVEVDVLTVGQLLARAGWDVVDLVKIDIEGMEEEILTKNNDWLSRTHALILEIHPTCSPAKIASALNDFGLELRQHRRGREPVYLATRTTCTQGATK
jgi:FkbM family methyltransferase